MENYKSIEIEAIIKEMQMIADRKYQEEEEAKIWEEARNNNNQ